MEGILISKVIQMKLVCKIQRCITIQSGFNFHTENQYQLHDLMDIGQRNDITHMSDTIPPEMSA